MQGLRAAAVVVAVGAVGTVLLVGAGVAAGQEPGSAATVDQVAAAIASDGWYADADAVGDREQLDDVAERLERDAEPMGFALLAEEPSGSSEAYAEDVLDALPAQGEVAIRTVVVLAGRDIAVVSDVWSDDAIDTALDETLDDLRSDRTDGLEALADSLADQPSGFDDDGDSGSGSGGSSNMGLIVGGIVVLILLSVGSRYLSGPGGLDGDTYDDGYDGGSSWRRRRRSSFSSFGSRSTRRSSSSRSTRRSSSTSRRGRGSRRL